jgi:O-glycosyl hydrolase
MSLRGPTKKTYVAMQFWRFIRPGMVRIDARSNAGPDTVAFEDFGTGTTVIVLLNRNRNPSLVALHLASRLKPRRVEFYITDASHDCSRIDGNHDCQSLSIPGESVVTLILGTGSPGRATVR